MTPVEIEAMLIRWSAAARQVESTDEDGRWQLLAEVVDPGPDLLAVSLKEAERRGPSQFAYTLAGQTKPQKSKKPGRGWLRDHGNPLTAAQAEPPIAA